MITRRRFIGSLGAGAGGLLLSGCDALDRDEVFRSVLRSSEGLTMRAQRLITDRAALAREYPASEMSPYFRPNGTRMPATEAYRRHAESRFGDWRLRVDRLVSRAPGTFDGADPGHAGRGTPITRHDGSKLVAIGS